jgi:hypothetical protein
VAQVYNHFKTARKVEDHLGYWNESGPDSPTALLRQLTRNELTRIKSIQALARKEGLVSETSFAKFRENLARENERRARALAAKEPIYGPSRYRETAFYYVQVGDLVYKLKQHLAQEAAGEVTDARIREFYEANRGLLEDKPLAELRERIVYALKSRAADQVCEQAIQAAKVELDEGAIAKFLPRHDPKAVAAN